MQHKTNIKRICLILTKSWKNVGLLRFVPFVVLNLIVPIINYMSYKKYGVDSAFLNEIINTALMFIPVFAAWWPLFILKEYVEADGNELLALFDKHWQEILFVCVNFIYILNVSVLFVVYTHLFEELKIFYVWLVILCIFYASLAWMISLLTRSTTLALMVVLIYTLINQLINNNRVICLLYTTTTIEETTRAWQLVYAPLAGLSAVFILLGYILKRKKRIYVSF